MTQQTKAKRRLTNIDFSKEGSHLALVHKDQGGSANGYSTLITKSTDKYSPEFIQKMQLIRVTMELDDYLEKFFGLWGSDAKVLAALMGYDDSQEVDTGVYNDDSFWSWWEDKFEDNPTQWREPTDQDKKDWITYRLEGIEILKSLKEPTTRLDVLAGLSEDAHLTIKKEQERFEKALNAKTNGVVKPNKKPVVNSTTTTKKATKAVNEENNMSGTNPELIAKAQFDEVQKALDTQKEELQKAEAEDEAEKLFKAVGELEEEQFQAVVEVVKALNKKVDESDLFKETGVKSKNTDVTKSANADPVADALVARLQKANQ